MSFREFPCCDLGEKKKIPKMNSFIFWWQVGFKHQFVHRLELFQMFTDDNYRFSKLNIQIPQAETKREVAIHQVLHAIIEFEMKLIINC